MSDYITAAATRAGHAPGECPSCGTPLGRMDPRVPEGYDDLHCFCCADDIEERHEWHLNGESRPGEEETWGERHA